MRVVGGLGAAFIARFTPAWYLACCAEMRVVGGAGAAAIARRTSATCSALSLLNNALRSRLLSVM